MEIENHIEHNYSTSGLAGIDDEACARKNYIVYLCRKGDYCYGWGNRQRGMVSSYLLALLTNRYFVIIHDEPCPLTNFLIPNLHNWTLCVDYIFNIPASKTQTLVYYFKDLSYRDTISSTDFDASFKKQVVFIKTNQVWTNAILANKKAAMTIPWAVGEREMTINRIVLKRLFYPTIALQREIMKYMDNVHQEQKLVCSHIRMGQNPSMPQDSVVRHNSSHVVYTIFQFLKKYDIPSRYIVYVASDSDDVKKQFKGAFNSCFTVDKPVLHVAKYKEEDDACEGFKTALLEQHLLSKCHILVNTGSSFGRFASYMNEVVQGLYYYDPIKKTIVNQTHYLSL